jgi:hypothetical protein
MIKNIIKNKEYSSYNYRYLFIPFVLFLIIEFSYWSSYHFDFTFFSILPNTKIDNISLFWSTFTSLTTLTGIMFAIFKERIIKFLYPSNLDLLVNNDQGTVLFNDSNLMICYHLKVKNIGKAILENVEFYFDSIIENEQNKIDIRSPIIWRRNEFKRHFIDILDFDHLDFVKAFLDFNKDIYGYQILLECCPKNFNYLLKNNTNGIITPTFLNKKKNLIFQYSISLNDINIRKIKEIIESLKKEICLEYKLLYENVKQKNPIVIENYHYLKHFHNESFFKDTHIFERDLNDKETDKLNDEYIPYCINRFHKFFNYSDHILNDEFIELNEILLLIQEILKITITRVNT